jgi:hypothetical protein
MKKTFLVIMVFVGVFACGAVVGGALTFRFRDSFVEGRGADRFTTEKRNELEEKLGLSVEQKKKMRLILRRFSEDQQAARKEMRVGFDRMRDDLDAILTPEQRKAFRDYRAQQSDQERERRAKGREGEPRVGLPDDSKNPAQPGTQKPLRERDRHHERPSSNDKMEPRVEQTDARSEPPPPPAP